MRYFYNVESDCYESEQRIQSDYFSVFENEYTSFADYLKNCMVCNNGALQTLHERKNELKKLVKTIDSDETETIKAIYDEIAFIDYLKEKEG